MIAVVPPWYNLLHTSVETHPLIGVEFKPIAIGNAHLGLSLKTQTMQSFRSSLMKNGIILPNTLNRLLFQFSDIHTIHFRMSKIVTSDFSVLLYQQK